MNTTLRRILLGTALAAAPWIHTSEDFIVRNGGSAIIHNNVILKSGEFKVESGGTLAIDLGGKVTATGNIIYGGTLAVNAAGGGTLAGGNVYRLFEGAAYPGSFATVTLPPLPSPLIWITDGLPLTGSIAILNPPPPPPPPLPPPPPSVSVAGGGTTPNIGGVSTFTVNDPNAVWNFGDGTTATGGTVTHIYTIPGTYQVTVTTIGAGGTPVSQTVTITVGATPFRISSARVQFSAGGDSLKLRGIVSTGAAVENQTVTATLGGLTRVFVLNAKGLGVSNGDALSVKTRRKGPTTKEASLTLSLKGALAADLKTNATLDANGFPAQIPVLVQLNGGYIGGTLNLNFKFTRTGATGVKHR